MTDSAETLAYFQNGPVAVIIGCGDLGMACARALGRRAPLILVDIDQARLSACVATLRHEGHLASDLACDISDAGQVERLGALLDRTAGVKVLAHVAAIGRSPLGWRKIMDVNLVGAHLVAKAVGPHMVRGGVGIFISSTGSSMTATDPAIDRALDDPFDAQFHDRLAAAFGGEPQLQEAYNLSKNGMNRLMRRLAVEWGPGEVRALIVSPGIVDTSMARAGGTEVPVREENGETRMATWAELAARTVPLGRSGIISEVSAVVDFAASDAASFVNGIDIPVDGGSLARRQHVATPAA